MKALTEKQQTCLSLIAAHWHAHGRGPTIRSLMEPMGVDSTCTIVRHIDALVKKGFVTRDRYEPRSVRPTNAVSHADLCRLLADAADALAFYAAESTYTDLVRHDYTEGEMTVLSMVPPVDLDAGERARTALAAIRALEPRT